MSGQDASQVCCDWCGNYTHNKTAICSANACIRQAEMRAEIVRLRVLVPKAWRAGLKEGRVNKPGTGYWDLSPIKDELDHCPEQKAKP